MICPSVTAQQTTHYAARNAKNIPSSLRQKSPYLVAQALQAATAVCHQTITHTCTYLVYKLVDLVRLTILNSVAPLGCDWIQKLKEYFRQRIQITFFQISAQQALEERLDCQPHSHFGHLLSSKP